MEEDGYLPSKEDLNELRERTLKELATTTIEPPKSRGDAVKVRRLLAVSLLCDNFQRSGAISNATLGEYRAMDSNIIRVSEHKSKASYGSLNLVVLDQLPYLHAYVDSFRPLLVKCATENKLFPATKVCDDVAAVCSMFGIRTCTPTLMRKAMSSAAYSTVSESQRRKIANHMTHRPETAYKAYSAKNRKTDAFESVSTMRALMYGEAKDDKAECGDRSVESGSAEVTHSRRSFTEAQLAALEKEARRLIDTGKAVSTAAVLCLMSKYKPVFDSRSPSSVESKLRSIVSDIQPLSRPKRRRTQY